MADPSNQDRLVAARAALEGWAQHKRSDGESEIIDVVADLLHLAASRGDDPDRVVSLALLHWSAEVE